MVLHLKNLHSWRVWDNSSPAWIGLLLFSIDLHHRARTSLKEALRNLLYFRHTFFSLLWSSSPLFPQRSGSSPYLAPQPPSLPIVLEAWGVLSSWAEVLIAHSLTRLLLYLLMEEFLTLELRLLDQQTKGHGNRKQTFSCWVTVVRVNGASPIFVLWFLGS